MKLKFIKFVCRDAICYSFEVAFLTDLIDFDKPSLGFYALSDRTTTATGYILYYRISGNLDGVACGVNEEVLAVLYFAEIGLSFLLATDGWSL